MRALAVVAGAAALCSCGRIGFDAGSASENEAGADASVLSLAFFGEGDIVDTNLSRSSADENCGSCTTIFGGNSEAGLLRVDVSALSPGVSVRSAVLEIWLITPFTPGGENELYVVREAWQEGEEDEQPGIANWNERLQGIAWTTEGVGNGSRDELPIATFVPGSLEEPIELALPIDIVEAWIEKPEENFGLVITASGYPGGGGDHPHFVSTESEFAAERGPKLTISYVP